MISSMLLVAVINTICLDVFFLPFIHGKPMLHRIDRSVHQYQSTIHNNAENINVNCPTSLIDGYETPNSNNFIYPRKTIQPIYQWQNNNGYCGEVSVMQAAMSFGGTWFSQFYSRFLCGAVLDSIPSGAELSNILPINMEYPDPNLFSAGSSLNQTGPDGWCELFNAPNYNAQMEYEDPNPNVVSGPNDFAHASLCVSNALMKSTIYPAESQKSGIAGYQDFMSWIKNEVIKGNVVFLAVIIQGGDDGEYDHEVTVTKIGTNHDPNDPTYYADDVIYFEEHGCFSADLRTGRLYPTNPSIPPGASDPSSACTPYIFGYEMGVLGNSRRNANLPKSNLYSVVLPGPATETQQGTDGYESTVNVTTRNWAVSVSGLIDPDNVFLPVQIVISSSSTNGVLNPEDPIAGYGYENPMVGDGLTGYLLGGACTNSRPSSDMTITLDVEVTDLVIGNAYKLYEYNFYGIEDPRGVNAQLKVPLQNLDSPANEKLASNIITFVATSSSYKMQVIRSSLEICVFRCIEVSDNNDASSSSPSTIPTPSPSSLPTIDSDSSSSSPSTIPTPSPSSLPTIDSDSKSNTVTSGDDSSSSRYLIPRLVLYIVISVLGLAVLIGMAYLYHYRNKVIEQQYDYKESFDDTYPSFGNDLKQPLQFPAQEPS